MQLITKYFNKKKKTPRHNKTRDNRFKPCTRCNLVNLVLEAQDLTTCNQDIYGRVPTNSLIVIVIYKQTTN